jgi:membrane protein required for colicin V production
MNWLDIVIIVLLVIGIFSGLKTGFIKSLFSLAGLVLGIALAGRYYTSLAGFLTFLPNETIANIAAFIIIFVVVLIIAAILGTVFTKQVSTLLLGWLNRLLGAVFSLFLGAFFIASILTIWVQFAGPNDIILGSLIAPILLDKVPFILTLLPAEFNNVPNFFH